MTAKVTENSPPENHKFDMLRELRKSQIPVPLTISMTRTSSNTSEPNKQQGKENYCNTTEISRDPQKVRRKISRNWKGKKRWTGHRNPETKTSTYHLLEPLEERINEFVESDTIEKVHEHEAIEWCSPLAVQPKAKNPKDIRVSPDLRILNQPMSQTRNVQTPITEDFVNTFKDCTVFSKIDFNHGYHQFTLD